MLTVPRAHWKLPGKRQIHNAPGGRPERMPRARCGRRKWDSVSKVLPTCLTKLRAYDYGSTFIMTYSRQACLKL